MECPHCGNSGAYTGLLWVHCQNEECKYFDARYTAKMKEERSRLLGRAVEKLILLSGEVADPDDDT